MSLPWRQSLVPVCIPLKRSSDLPMKAPPSFLMQEATALHREGQLVEAAARYEQVLAQERRNTDAMFLLATVQCQQGRLADGIESARKAIKLNPKYGPAYNLIGVAQQQLGRTELAQNSFDRAVAADPKFAEAWFNRALNLLSLGRRSHAIESFDHSIALNPDHALARHGRGTALMLEDRNEAALSDFTAAVALDPNLAHALANRGYLLNRLGRFDEAVADLARALALAPQDDDVRYHAAEHSGVGDLHGGGSRTPRGLAEEVRGRVQDRHLVAGKPDLCARSRPLNPACRLRAARGRARCPVDLPAEAPWRRADRERAVPRTDRTGAGCVRHRRQRLPRYGGAGRHAGSGGHLGLDE